MAACLDKQGGELVRKAGVMAVVLTGGEVKAGDPIVVEAPLGPSEPLKAV
jgi:MOSC domain-containing protein YiiM